MKQLTDEVFAQVRGALEQADIYLEEGSQSHSINRLAIAALDTAQPVQVNTMLVEDVNSEIVKRYKVEKTKGGFWTYCVKAGDGTMGLFIGSKKQADHVQQALQSACLDGAFMAFAAAKQAQPERAPSVDKRLLRLQEAVIEMYCDWKKGDFALPRLAQLDLEACFEAANCGEIFAAHANPRRGEG